MIKFKPYLYRDKLKAIEIATKVESGELTEEDDIKFLMEMVEEWDLKHVVTKNPIPVGEYLDLHVVQIAEVQRAWREYSTEVWAEVKKTREPDSSSGSSE